MFKRVNHLKKLKHFLSIAVMVLTCFTIIGNTVSVNAVESIEDVPYQSYTYWEGDESHTPLPIRSLYNTDKIIDSSTLGITPLVEPRSISASNDGKYLYVADSGNSRILVIDSDTDSLVRIIEKLNFEGKEIKFQGATDVYPSTDGRIFVSDTQNKRILVLNNEDIVINVISTPKGVGIPDDFSFAPTRVVMDNKGYLYVASQGCYYGLLVFDEHYNFLGFFGANSVTTTLLGGIKNFFTNIFMTNDKNSGTVKKLPSESIDITIDENGFIYNISSGTEGQLKRLSLKGTNTFVYKYSYENSKADKIKFGDYDPNFWYISENYNQTFTGIEEDDGFIYLLESRKGRIFMYDKESRLLCAFGGGMSNGNQKGTFVSPISITCAKGKIYVLDFVTGKITSFSISDYGSIYTQAETLTIKGYYSKAKPLWEEVLALDKNNQRAYEGIAKAFLAEKNYKSAMSYAKKALDQMTYASAKKAMQKEFITRNFLWIFLVSVVAIIGLFIFLSVKHKAKKGIKNGKLHIAFTTWLRPFNSFYDVKYRGATSYIISSIIIGAFYITTVLKDLYTGFMYRITDTENYNALYTLLGSAGILVLWAVVNWLVCTLMSGKGSFAEIYSVTAYSVVPIIIYNAFFTVSSHIVSAASFFGILNFIVIAYTVIILLIGMTVIHEYSFFKAIGTSLLTVIGMMLLIFIIFAVFTLAQQLVGFIVGIIKELIMR